MATIRFPALVPIPVTPLAPAVPGGTAFPAIQAALPLVVAGEAGTAPGAAPSLALGAGAGQGLADSTSMRPDQLFMARQLAWPSFDGATLAAAWRNMVRNYGLQVAALQQQAGGQHLPGSMLMAGQYPAAASPQAPALQWHPDAWRFVTPGPGRQLTLRVLAGGPDQPPGRRRRGKLALRVELTLSDGTHASVQLEPLPDGVMMELAAPYTSSLELLRAALPALKEAIERAGLTLLRTTLRHALAPGRPLVDGAGAAVLPAPLFRAMADVALLLAMPPAGDEQP